MVVALKPLHDRATIKRVVVSTYQSVSGAGKDAMDELWTQTKGMYVPGQEVEPKKFPKQIAFNVHPADRRLHGGRLHQEEWKMVAETKKILDPEDQGDGDLRARAGVRRPFRGDRTSSSRSRSRAEEARDILREAPGCLVVDKREPGGYITPHECVGEYATYVSRIREDATVENGLRMWVVTDNLRKGAALNAVQIAETA